MHANTHVAFGVIITSLCATIIPLQGFDFLLAICGSFAQDFDLLFANFRSDENHRLLPTHTLWPGIIGTSVGVIWTIPWVFLAGVNLISHTLLDSIDWGVTFFGNNKISGVQILARHVKGTIPEVKEKYPNFRCFFTLRWYRNHIMQFIEVVSISGMVASLVFTVAPWAILALIPYGGFSILHYGSLIQCEKRYRKFKDPF